PTLVYSGTGRSKSFSNKSNGTYYYRVQACNGPSCSGYRNTVVYVAKGSGGGGGGGGGTCNPPYGCEDPLFAPEPPVQIQALPESGDVDAGVSPSTDDVSSDLQALFETTINSAIDETGDIVASEFGLPVETADAQVLEFRSTE